MSVTGGEEKGPGPAAGTSRSSPNPDHASEPSSQEAPEDHETEEGTTPDQEARPESEERVKALLRAYQETLDTVEALPAMVWVPWDSKRPGRYFKVPYLRWFLKDFVVHHIGRSLDTLDRRYHAIAARSGDLDANGANREAVKLYLQSLPRLPYRVLIFTAVLAALVIALPLKSFGNVFYVLDLIGATLRFDVGYVGRALQRNELGPTVRALIVLLIGLIVVAGLITSPFGLKRILFNLHPWASERLDSTAARGHGLRAEGRYALEDEVFEDAGIRRPHEGRGSRLPNLLALVPAGFRAPHGGLHFRDLHVVEREPQIGHRSARRRQLLLAKIVLGILCFVHRSRTGRVFPPLQTTHHSLEEAKPETQSDAARRPHVAVLLRGR